MHLWKKHKEIITYIFWGVAATGVNWLCYSMFVGVLHLDINVGNILSWLITIIFAFITNKQWVFCSKSWDIKTVLKEGGMFFSSRIVTGVIEIGLLPVLVSMGLNQSLFGIEAAVAKAVVSVIVIVLNYIFSKLLIFRKKKENEADLGKKTETMEKDWRLLHNDEENLYGLQLFEMDYADRQKVEYWDHDHCMFCMDKFSDHEGYLHHGYCKLDTTEWICQSCFEEFVERFHFEVIDRNMFTGEIPELELTVQKLPDGSTLVGRRYAKKRKSNSLNSTD